MQTNMRMCAPCIWRGSKATAGRNPCSVHEPQSAGSQCRPFCCAESESPRSIVCCSCRATIHTLHQRGLRQLQRRRGRRHWLQTRGRYKRRPRRHCHSLTNTPRSRSASATTACQSLWAQRSTGHALLICASAQLVVSAPEDAEAAVASTLLSATSTRRAVPHPSTAAARPAVAVLSVAVAVAVGLAQDFLSRATRCNCCRRSTNASRCETGDLRKDTSRVFVSTCRAVRCHARVANGELDLSAQAPKVSLGSSDCSATACATASTYDGSCSQLSPGAQPTCSPQKSAGAAPHRQGQRHAACAETGSRLF